MFVDLNKVTSDPFKDKKYDVCICGAGVAGITLALKLSKRLKVILLEAGDEAYTSDSQAVYLGKNIGREYFHLTATRLRFFGGTSNHWTGTCRPLDKEDFDEKSYVKYSGWPIERSDLDPYLEETKSILDIAPEVKETAAPSAEDFPKAVRQSQDFKSIEFWRSAPTRFGEKYRAELESMPNLECYLNANVVNIALDENLSNVKQFEVRNYEGTLFKIDARVNIMAAGGLETPRILLNCNRQIKPGLGNEAGLMGRFFAEHPHHTVGNFILEDRVKNNLAENWVSRANAKRFISPSPGLMQREKILNFGLRYMPSEPSADTGFKARLKEVLCDTELAQSAVEAVRGERLDCRDGLIWVATEQTPNPASRVGLGSELDQFGMRRIVLDWQLSEIDKRTIRLAALSFGTFFASSGLGRVQVADWLPTDNDDFEPPGFGADEIAAHHHMCTTRMSSSPRDGVVDSDQKIFGIDNLYIAGSSVFSTAGHANPTFTIVQMTLRLADHINGVLEKHG